MSEAAREASNSDNFDDGVPARADLSRADKAEVRRAVRTLRAAMPPAVHNHATQALTEHLTALTKRLGARSVACYFPVEHEPDTVPFLMWATGAGIEVLLPVSLEGSRLDWVHFSEVANVVYGRHKILEPQGPRLGETAFSHADLVFVPACAVDTQGTRLGWGMGYYDRALARLPLETPIYAVVFDTDFVAFLPREPHDVPVTGVVTPAGIYTFNTPGGDAGGSPDATL